MKLDIDGVELPLAPDVEAQLMEQVAAFLLNKYEGLGSSIQLGIKMLVQHKVIGPMEAALTEKFGKEVGRQARPPRGADPVQHAAKLLLPQLKEMLKSVTIHASTNETADCITALAVAVQSQGAGGGPLGADRSDGIGQDGRPQISG